MIDVLIAVGILFAIGVIAAIVLALASHYMAVPVDEKASALRECLPGANCGACGYTGCDGYAEALAKGEAAPNLCIPGGASAALGISEILGVEASVSEKRVAYVHCNGTPDVTDKASDYDGYRTCAAMCLVCGGPNSCKFGCLGCGDCAAVCPTNAICVKDGVARINPTKCIACGKCVKTCPKHIISLIPADAKVAVSCSSKDAGAATRKKCTNGCIACRKCEKTCPNGAITVENNLAKIDYSKCTGCGMCHDACPVKCIASIGDVVTVVESDEEFR